MEAQQDSVRSQELQAKVFPREIYTSKLKRMMSQIIGEIRIIEDIHHEIAIIKRSTEGMNMFDSKDLRIDKELWRPYIL